MFCLGMLEINFIIFGYFTLALEIASDSVTIIRGCLMRLPNYLPFASLGLVTIFFLWKVYAPYPNLRSGVFFFFFFASLLLWLEREKK